MNKIPTLFLRDKVDRRHVIQEVNPAARWVIDGKGMATRKYDGTCVMLDNTGNWWARREVKPGKIAPPNFIALTSDPVTGKTVGWEHVGQSCFAKFHAEAITARHGERAPGTYELIGPRINGNPEDVHEHVLVPHAGAETFSAPRDFDGLRVFLLSEDFVYEGIVWHHPDGRMAKLKVRDFA